MPNTRGIARERPVGELRQLAVEAGRQVLADLADLLFDDVVVVEQPLGGRRDRPALARGSRDGAIRREQYRLVVTQPRAERRATNGPRS